MSFIKRLITLSRPHFWLYEFGTFLLGVVIGATQTSEVFTLQTVWWGLYFLIPANLLIYGINDVYDYETDMRNPKKVSYESVLPKELHKKVLLAVGLTSVPFILLVPENSNALVALFGFFFFATFYSAPPIRAKAKPLIDSVFSAGHYVATGVFGYFLIAGEVAWPWQYIVAGMAWAMAMHAYSAVPDIQADRDAGLKTTAILFGHKNTIWYCLVLYALAVTLTFSALGIISVILFVPYAIILLRSLSAVDESLLKLYAYFPYLNALVGMVLTFLAFYINGWLEIF